VGTQPLARAFRASTSHSDLSVKQLKKAEDENVASIACRLRSMVAIMYKPFSVKAFGATLVLANFVVDIFDRKSENSIPLSSNM
jgi:hypothetical protein